jgi:hypothetical protein
MTTRSKSYFLSGQQTTTNRRFRENNRPTELTFTDLFDSIPFIAETSDTASETKHGLVKIATSTEIKDKTDEVNGFQKVPRVSHLPAVGPYCASGSTNIATEQLEGIKVTEMQEPLGRLKYVVNLLYDTNWFHTVADELTFTDEFIALWNTLITLIDEEGDILFDIDNFPATAFLGGGVINNSSVFTIDVDDSTLQVNSVTKKLEIKNGGITLDKLLSLNAGEIIVAPTGGGTPEVISLLGVGKILVGTATGVEVKDINDYLLSIAITDNSVKARKLDPGTLGDGITKDMASSDASKLKVNLSDAASMEFASGKLQLKNDEDDPDTDSYYGTDIYGNKGYNTLRKYPERYVEQFTLGVGETTISIDPEDVTDYYLTSTKIKAGYCTVTLFERTGSGPYILVEEAETVQITVSGMSATDYVTAIDYTGLKESVSYVVVVDFIRITE